MFVVNSRNLFLDNVALYTIETRNSYNLHPPLSHLTKYQKGVHYAGIRIFTNFHKEYSEWDKRIKKYLKELSPG